MSKSSHEGPVCFQLSSRDPQELAIATRIATDYGADYIDLNCGCPKKKIRSKRTGSHLLSEPSHLYQLMRAMKLNTDKPVSIKIRVDARSDDRFNENIANAAMDAGIDTITVHGRHWTEGYDVACSYDDIRFFVETLPIPVIGNGDVACIDSLKKMLNTGCAGVMIGRAGVGQPWLIAQLQHQFAGMPFTAPTLPEVGEIFFAHLEGLCAFMQTEKYAIIQARNFAKYYARNMPQKALFCEAMQTCESLNDVAMICRQFFGYDVSIKNRLTIV